MFSVRPDLHWLRFGLSPSAEREVPGLHNFKSPEEVVPGFRVKPPEEPVAGFRVRQPDERAPGFRMNADGSIGEAATSTAPRDPDLGSNPFDFFGRPGQGINAFTPVADKPPWGGWGMAPYPEDNDNVPPNRARTPICDMANFRCQQFGNRADPEKYTRWVYDCGQSYGLCQNYENDPNRIGRGGDYISFPDGSAVIFRRGYPPSYVPSPRL